MKSCEVFLCLFLPVHRSCCPSLWSPSHPISLCSFVYPTRQARQERIEAAYYNKDNWRSARHPIYGSVYYVNLATGDKTWDLPDFAAYEAHLARKEAAAAAAAEQTQADDVKEEKEEKEKEVRGANVEATARHDGGEDLSASTSHVAADDESVESVDESTDHGSDDDDDDDVGDDSDNRGVDLANSASDGNDATARSDAADPIEAKRAALAVLSGRVDEAIATYGGGLTEASLTLKEATIYEHTLMQILLEIDGVTGSEVRADRKELVQRVLAIQAAIDTYKATLETAEESAEAASETPSTTDGLISDHSTDDEDGCVTLVVEEADETANLGGGHDDHGDHDDHDDNEEEEVASVTSCESNLSSGTAASTESDDALADVLRALFDAHGLAQPDSLF